MRLMQFEAWSQFPNPLPPVYINPEAVVSLQAWPDDRVLIHLQGGYSVEVKASDVTEVVKRLVHDPNASTYVFPSGA